MFIPLKVRRIGTSKHKFAQFAEVFLFLPGENVEGQQVYALFKCELYLVEGFQVNILIKNNILTLKGFILNLRIGHAVVGSCGVIISIKARQKGQFLKKQLLAKSNGIVPLCSKTMIPLLLVPLSDNRDFLFHLTTQTNLTMYTHIVDYETSKVLVRNTSNQPLHISC